MKKYILSALALLPTFIVIAQNTLPASGNVGINTTSPNYRLDVRGTGNMDSLLINNQLVLSLPALANPEKGSFNPIWMAIHAGRKISQDEQFDQGMNSLQIYNNSGNGSVTANRLAVTGAPNTSGYVIEFTHTGGAYPGYGGFFQPFNTAANRTYVHVFRAKYPTGYTLGTRSNSLGNGGSIYWITSKAGTGKWEDYAYVINAGNTGTFSSAGHVVVETGPTPTAQNPLIYQLASSCIYDMSNFSDENIRNQSGFDQPASIRIANNAYIGGNIGVGTTDTKGYKLAVAGNLVAERAVIKQKTNWPDYVFEKGYKVPPLTETEVFIKREKHLPEMPSAMEIEKSGVDLVAVNQALTKNVEHLTLQLIEFSKRLEELERQLSEQKRNK